jgi:1-acyl-sn-glycerol-3-phosphate acyltransferase
MIDHVNRPGYLFLRSILKLLITCYLHMFKGYHIEGKKNLPHQRMPCILIANHAAFIDSVYLICAVKPRFTICGAKPKYFQNFFRRHVFRTANILKVESHEQFLHDCGLLLRSGEAILVYPEMGRNPEGLGEFKNWAADVALAQQVPVIPCYLYGTTAGQSGKKRLRVGTPIKPQGSPETLSQHFRESILKLKPAEQGDA